MVFQPTTANVVEVKVCSISFQRHNTSLLNQQKHQRANFNGQRLNPRAMMTDNQSRNQQLPVVELKPFTKKVWRREKSLPDFYDRKINVSVEENSGAANPKTNSLEISPTTSRLVRELTETRKSLETRQGLDSSLGKYRNHPKAEFCHESTKTWRKQDFIPGFITRFERTRTSMEILSRENTSIKQRFNLSSNDSIWDTNDTTSTPGQNFKIRGGKMSQQIHRRHLLYLNPLDSYRQPGHWGSHFNTTDNSRQSTGRHHLVPSRNSFPLTSGRARELFLSGAHFNHPLKPIPIQREDSESPHKFNNKLGAAKCSLQILNKLGNPTKLEKALEKEYEMNLERYRKDRLFLPHDLRSLSNNYIQFDSSPTMGEMFLRNAQEANKAKKQSHPTDEKINGLVRQDSNGWYRNDAPVPDIIHRNDTLLVNQAIHPIDTVLHEESEIPFDTQSEVNQYKSELAADAVGHITSSGSEVMGRLHHVPDATMVYEDSNDTNGQTHIVNVDNHDLKLAPSVPPLISSQINENNVDASNVSPKNSDNLNNNDDNNNNVTSPSTIDSSRIETNIEYLHNLQRKSKSASSSKRPNPSATPAPSAREPTTSAPQELQTVEQPSQEERSPKTISNAPAHSSDTITTEAHCQDLSESHHELQPNALLPTAITNGPSSLSGSNVESQSLSDSNPPTSREEPPKEDSPQQLVLQPSSEQTNFNDGANAQNIDEDSSDKSKSNIISEQPLNSVISKSHEQSQNGDPSPLIENGVPVSVNKESRNVAPKANSVARSSKIPSQDPISDEKEKDFDTSNRSVVKDDPSPTEGVQITGTQEDCLLSERQERNVTLKETDTVLEGLETKEISAEKRDSLPVPQIEIENQKPGDANADQSQSLNLEDEGISMATPTERTMLDSSMTDPCSEHEVSPDNGDSGISTTFITADESRPKELGGLMVFD